MTVRVLLVDDEALVRAGFRLVLRPEHDIELVGEATDGATAIEAALRLRPNVIVMDVRMPGTDGLQATHGGSSPRPPAVASSS